MELFKIVVLAAFLALPVVLGCRQLLRRRRATAKVADVFRRVGGVLREPLIDHRHSSVVGLAHGLRTTFRLTTDDPDDRSEPWTEVDVVLPAPTELELLLRPETDADREEVDAGSAVDVQLGDPSFDPLFVVEAAPADVVCALLDERTRARLVALYPCQLVRSAQCLRFTTRGWQQDHVAVEIVDLVASIAARIGAAYAAVEEERVVVAAREHVASAYRGADPEALRLATELAGPAWEVASLQRLREERRIASRRQQRGCAILGFCWVALLAIVAVWVSRC